MKQARIQKDSYFDSVFLMSLGGKLKGTPGVRDATVAMATPMNIELLLSEGWSPESLAGAGPNDLVLAVDCPDAASVDAAFAAAGELLAGTAKRGGARSPERAPSLDAAIAQLPGANIALVSVPGPWAAREARRALDRGLHVMIFSDNVSLEDEIALKTLGRERGLLVMGPDCGTAIISGKPLCFANVVKRGPVGVVAASGTGLQEVTCLIDRLGSGVSQGIGTGGRDLKNERVGGITMLMGIEALAADPETAVIVIVSKPPAPAVAATVAAALAATGKPSVIHFVGMKEASAPVGKPAPAAGGSAPRWAPRWARSLEEAAILAVELAGGAKGGFGPGPFATAGDEAAITALAERESARLLPAQRWLRGYYTGGTVADEAMFLLHDLTGSVSSNNQTDPAWILADPRVSKGHTIVDLGDDSFTVGRPHPMIDPSTRTERILAEKDDPSIAVILVDVVLGYGSHEDPAGALVPALVAARKAAEARGGYLPVVASVIGTPADPQGFARQVATLEAAGCLVMPSNHRAALLAARIARRGQLSGGATR